MKQRTDPMSWPPDVEFLYFCARTHTLVGSQTIDRAKKAGPQYFNKLGEFDPFFESRSWWHIAKGRIWRKTRWWFWCSKRCLGLTYFSPLRYWIRRKLNIYPKCFACGKPIRDGIINHINEGCR